MIWAFVLALVVLTLHLPAQQAEADRKLFEEFKAKAEKGDVEAKFYLGVYYFLGQGVAEDKTEAVKWIREAAQQGHAIGQFTLGLCYLNGDGGVVKDAPEAVKWFRKAAEQGYPMAQYSLGISYKQGDGGLAQDASEALKWYRKAAAQGLAEAQCAVGLCYATGAGVDRDAVESLRWYRRAAEQGYDQAQSRVGMAYSLGKGVTKDTVEAAKWFRKAAEQGYAEAQCLLGAAYFDGDGVPKDYVEAHNWMNLASAQGLEKARQVLPKIESQMTTEQKAEAQRLARQFKPRATRAASSPEGNAGLRPSSGGTGFFITEDGFLVTNAHVVKNDGQIRLVTSAGFVAARLAKVDAANDLALLKAEGKFSPLPVAASRMVRLGNTVATVGFPNLRLQGFAPKLAKGEIAGLSGAQDDPRYFQISVPVQPGNSGGALVDERGNVVGVVSAKLSVAAGLATSGALPENVNYAVKSSFLLGFLESVPEVSAKLKEGNGKERNFEDVVKSAEEAAGTGAGILGWLSHFVRHS